MKLTPDEYYRVRKQVKKIKGCWLFTGSLNQFGYGRIKLKDGSSIVAHHVSYIFWKGDIPKNKELDHTCSKRNCVNPKHLDVVTRSENIKRTVLRGRLNNHNQKLKFCKRGHKFDKKLSKSGKRWCSQCHVIRHSK